MFKGSIVKEILFSPANASDLPNFSPICKVCDKVFNAIIMRELLHHNLTFGIIEKGPRRTSHTK